VYTVYKAVDRDVVVFLFCTFQRTAKWRPVRKADNLPPSCAVVTKSGNHNVLERIHLTTVFHTLQPVNDDEISSDLRLLIFTLFLVQCHHMSLWTSWSSLLGMAGV